MHQRIFRMFGSKILLFRFFFFLFFYVSTILEWWLHHVMAFNNINSFCKKFRHAIYFTKDKKVYPIQFSSAYKYQIMLLGLIFQHFPIRKIYGVYFSCAHYSSNGCVGENEEESILHRLLGENSVTRGYLQLNFKKLKSECFLFIVVESAWSPTNTNPRYAFNKDSIRGANKKDIVDLTQKHIIFYFYRLQSKMAFSR